MVNSVDCLIWLGDMNYRVDMAYLDVKALLNVAPELPARSETPLINIDADSGDSPPRLPPRPASPTRQHRSINKTSLKTLLLHDQFINQRALGLFPGFNESEVQFQPSYKFDVGTGVYDSSEKRRTPSWCDRIIWIGEGIGEGYVNRMEFSMSDHKPVQLCLKVPVRIIDMEKMARVEEEITKRLDILESAAIPDLRIVGDMMVDLGLVGRDVRTCRFAVSNYGIVDAKWEFVSKGEMGICKSWINVGEGRGVVPAGESSEVVLNIEVGCESAADFNFGRDCFEDILVLHGT
jgi:phosphatidylinositol-bisphosphatase